MRRTGNSTKLKCVLLTAVLLAPMTTGALIARADEHEVTVPLRDGKLSLPELSAALSEKLGLPAIEFGTVSVSMQGLGSTVFVKSFNTALGDGCRVTVDQNAVTVHFDTAKLPHSVNEAKLAVRTFTAAAAPEATAKQAESYGLLLPAKMKAGAPIVILLHGVDCTRDGLEPLGKLLNDDGYQVGYFGYPDDQPLADSAKRFTEQLAAYRQQFPDSQVDIVAFSMGGLVARSTVEGANYPGGVNRFILLAPPNHGSQWAHVRFILEAREQWQLFRHNANWRPSWMITDGLGEAGGDLLPDSKFLSALNDQPRRAGVKYTIINGDVHPVWQAAGSVAGSAVNVMGPNVAGWIKADVLADKLRDHRADSDGPVSKESTKLEGVSDVVTLRADHNSLYEPQGNDPPAAWATIRARLKDGK